MDITIIKKIPKNIKKFRLANKLTQEQLAEMLDLDTQYYAQLERGSRNFNIEKIVNICELLHVDISDIIPISQKKADTSAIVTAMIPRLKELTPAQLAAVDNFLTTIVPYIK